MRETEERGGGYEKEATLRRRKTLFGARIPRSLAAVVGGEEAASRRRTWVGARMTVWGRRGGSR